MKIIVCQMDITWSIISIWYHFSMPSLHILHIDSSSLNNPANYEKITRKFRPFSTTKEPESHCKKFLIERPHDI